MAGGAFDQMKRRPRLGAWLRGLVLVAILVVLAAFVWRLASDKSGVRREAPPMAVVALTPPPPPPPPPKEKPPEPQETVSTPSPAPKAETPQKADAAPKALTESGPPQSADAFGMKAGAGGGLTVGGDPNGSDQLGGGDFGASGYAHYVAGVLQRAAQADPSLRGDLFSAELDVWIAPDGGVTRVEIAKSSGERGTDRALIALLHTLRRFDEPPPPHLTFPAHIVLHGRKA
jgi:protein TonB